tara:strand:- start:7341 stop:7952 length:612 start_codon:yes stop_codon:yes gene_type:complete
MYYPPNKIKPNQYTRGGEYALVQNGSNYIGYYFTTFDGKAFTGKTIGDTSNAELIISSQTTSPSQDYSLLSNPFYTQILQGNNDDIQNLPKYSMPRPYTPIPTDSDYQRRFFTRYFMRRVNGSNISEISSETFNDLPQGEKYNSALYVTTSLSWQISGQLETTTENGIITRGVRQVNMETVQQTNLVFIGINQYLTDYAEFYE